MYLLKIFKWYYYHFLIFLLDSDLEKTLLSQTSIAWGVLAPTKNSNMTLFKIPHLNLNYCQNLNWTPSKKKLQNASFYTHYNQCAMNFFIHCMLVQGRLNLWTSDLRAFFLNLNPAGIWKNGSNMIWTPLRNTHFSKVSRL